MKFEFNINSTQSIIRTAAQQSRFVMTRATLFVPEVVLPTKETQILYKSISGGKFVKELEWDDVGIVEQTQNVTANTPFNILLGANQVGVSKQIAIVLSNFYYQLFNQTTSNIVITDFYIEIDSKDYFNMNVRTNQGAYRVLVDNFNMAGSDINTGSLLLITDGNNHYRNYTIDLSNQELFCR